MDSKGGWYCDACGKTFLRLCNYSKHLSHFQCDGTNESEAFEKEDVIPKKFSKEYQEKDTSHKDYEHTYST